MNNTMDIDQLMHELAEAFLRWPLPASVCADHCTTYPVTSDNPALQRVGTNLLSYTEARAMLDAVVRPTIADLHQDRLRLRENAEQLRQALEDVRGFGRSDMGHQQLCDYVTERATAALEPFEP